jgi:hypothetical protein
MRKKEEHLKEGTAILSSFWESTLSTLPIKVSQIKFFKTQVSTKNKEINLFLVYQDPVLTKNTPKSHTQDASNLGIFALGLKNNFDVIFLAIADFCG